MRTVIGAAVLATGIVLLVFGYHASESLGSELSRFFRGTPTDRAVGMVLGGAAATILGLGILGFRDRKP